MDAGTRTTPQFTRGAKLGLLALLAIYGLRCYLDPQGGHIIDSVNLAIHETGHLVFAPFGEFIQFAGGTLFQLIVPFTFLAYFVKFAPERDDFAASVMLWWVAVNFWNIAVYAADARTQALPLVGGGEHDWAYLLGRTGLLAHDQGVASTFSALGWLFFVYGLVAGARAALQPPAVADDVRG
ncbi:MAG TPA: hypothetical protein VFK16_00095 [Gemmatimonadaceae bacterium]|nr:hypothetical protein [Gemmatimonadaceae bacterium]